jgi:hypothetical protein
MSDEQAGVPVMLVSGPYEGQYEFDEIKQYIARSGGVRIPYDEHFLVTDKQPFAYALYGLMDIPGPGKIYAFRKFVRLEDAPFVVELVGGPLAGSRPMTQPVLGLPPIVMIPTKSEPVPKQEGQEKAEGRQRVFAVYKSGAHLGGDHKLIFDSIVRDVVTGTRIIFELSGGPYDGMTYDTDAGILDQESVFWAQGHYLVTDQGQTGKQFMVAAPQFRSALEEFGEAAVKHGGPYPMHLYEVTGKVESEYEVYVQAKYAGLYKEPTA